MEFEAWFKKTTEQDPYPYQIRFATGEKLPDLVDVPTGVGKTAMAVLGWLWRRRFADTAVRTATPRRLVYCLPMRVLVEQTVENSEKWINALVGVQYIAPVSAPKVYTLMGGEIDMDWDAYPEADAILVGTQDQLLSRALNRGYAMSRYRWPMHFALLNNDCLWIMDEVQLMGAGLATTAQLQAFREKLGAYGPAQSIWMSATLKTEALVTIDFTEQAKRLHPLCLLDSDKAHTALAQRLNSQKPLAKAQTSWNQETAESYGKDLADEVCTRHKTGTLTLVVVNRVSRAQEIFVALQRALKNAKNAPNILLIHSRFRQAERQKLQVRLKEKPSQGQIVIATQAIEAGVDLSARTLFTELAPWSSLVQRFGRCNRFGEYDENDPAHVFWIDLETSLLNKKGEREPIMEAIRPYEINELDWAREQLNGLLDVGPQEVSKIRDPHPFLITHVLRRKDLIDLFDTTPDLAGNDIDVSRYIREAENNDVQIYWRELTDGEPKSEEPAPRREELCAVSIGNIKKLLKKEIKAYRWDGLDRDWIRVKEATVWPGLTLLLDTSSGGYSIDIGWTGKPDDVVTTLPPPPDAPPMSSYDDNYPTVIGRYVTLTDHSRDVAGALDMLRNIFSGSLPDVPWDELSKAARWHDIGKAHAVFQQMLPVPLPGDDLGGCQPPWAKSAHKGGIYPRRHFRHELASALALLQHKESDLAAYLAAAHHGKVRLSIRSLPGEKIPNEGRRFARGVWEGDELPAVDLGDKIQSQALVLTLAYMEMGESSYGASWLERTLKLRDQYGPFQLAWMETLVRVADWRASKKEAENTEVNRP